MYQNYTTDQTEFVLNFDFTVSSTHIVRLIDAFVDSIPNEILLKDNVSTTVVLFRIQQSCLKYYYLRINDKLFWSKNRVNA